MPQSAIAADILKPLDVQRELTPQPSLDHVVVLDDPSKLVDLLLGEIVASLFGIDFRSLTNFLGGASPNTVDIGQRYIEMFVGQIDTCNTSH